MQEEACLEVQKWRQSDRMQGGGQRLTGGPGGPGGPRRAAALRAATSLSTAEGGL